MTHEEYSTMFVQTKEQFKNETPLFGKNGEFDRLLEDFLNAALEGEMNSHLAETKSQKSSHCNGI